MLAVLTLNRELSLLAAFLLAEFPGPAIAPNTLPLSMCYPLS